MAEKKKSVRSFGEIVNLINAADSSDQSDETDAPAEKSVTHNEEGESHEYAAPSPPLTKEEIQPGDGFDEMQQRQKELERREKSLEHKKLKTEEWLTSIKSRRHDLNNLRRSIRQEIKQLKLDREEQEKIIALASKTFDSATPVRDFGECIEELVAQRSKVKASLASLKIENRKAEVREQSLEKRGAELKKTEARVKKQQEINRKIRIELRETKVLNESLLKEVRSGNRKKTRLQKQLDGLADQLATLETARRGIYWVLENARSIAPAPWSEVVLVGSEPIDDVDMLNFLIDRGVDVYDTNTEGVPYMIVGRSGWFEEELEMQIAAQQGGNLKVYSQEMALLALAAGTEIFEVADEESLTQLAGDHPALEFLRDGELRWPLFEVPSIPNEFRPFEFEDWSVDESPIKSMGYTVGKTKGLPAEQRREILRNAYQGELPNVHSSEYMQDWGRPRTRRRLWRVANHLAWLARAWKRTPSHAYAVDDWTSDLADMERKFYKPWMRFAWPKVKVPGVARRR